MNDKTIRSCFVYDSEDHWTNECPNHKFKQEKKAINMVATEIENKNM